MCCARPLTAHAPVAPRYAANVRLLDLAARYRAAPQILSTRCRYSACASDNLLGDSAFPAEITPLDDAAQIAVRRGLGDG